MIAISCVIQHLSCGGVGKPHACRIFNKIIQYINHISSLNKFRKWTNYQLCCTIRWEQSTKCRAITWLAISPIVNKCGSDWCRDVITFRHQHTHMYTQPLRHAVTSSGVNSEHRPNCLSSDSINAVDFCRDAFRIGGRFLIFASRLNCWPTFFCNQESH